MRLGLGHPEGAAEGRAGPDSGLHTGGEDLLRPLGIPVRADCGRCSAHHLDRRRRGDDRRRARAARASSSAHSPATAREIYTGKLLASLIPGYLTTIVGFGLYSLLVNVIAGPEVGHWFFPTPQWLILMLWVIPPFLAFTLSLVLRLSAKVKSTAAAQQASGLVSLPLIGLAYGQSWERCSARRRPAGSWHHHVDHRGVEPDPAGCDRVAGARLLGAVANEV